MKSEDVITEVFAKRKKPDVIKQLFELDLDALEREYRAGKKQALLVAIVNCLASKTQPPEWAREDFCKAVLWGTGPWEDDFGRRKKRVTARDGAQVSMAVNLFNRIEALRKESPVDPALFERVGKEFGLSAGTASGLYYNKEIRRFAVTHNFGLAVQQMMSDEIGPEADENIQKAWLRQNTDRITEIYNRLYSTALRRPPPEKIVFAGF